MLELISESAWVVAFVAAAVFMSMAANAGPIDDRAS